MTGAMTGAERQAARLQDKWHANYAVYKDLPAPKHSRQVVRRTVRKTVKRNIAMAKAQMIKERR